MANEDIVSHDTSEDIEEVASYWTEDNMRSAIPIELPSLEGTLTELSNQSPENEPWVQDGAMQEMPSTAAGGEFLEYGDFREELSTPTRASSTTLVPSANFQQFPWQAVGKLYMVFGGQNYVGSAWAIAGTESCIFTAGHCIHDRNSGWASRVMFKGRYDNGSSVGTWYMKELNSLEGWTKNGNFKYDMGACIATRTIRPTIGALGWMANYPPNQGPYTGIGYPAAPIPGYNFNGQRMWQSVGNYINGSNPIQAYNNMTGGCSGGPWSVVKNGAPYANGLNSFRYTSNPATLYSPYFGNGFVNIFNAIKGK